MFKINRNKICLYITIIFWLGYLLFLLPYSNGDEYAKIAGLQFMNYDVYEQYNFDRFSIGHIVLYFFMFYMIYHNQITVLLENNSYMSMVFNRFDRRKIFLMTLKETLSDHLIYIIVGILNFIIIDSFNNLMIIGQININITGIVLLSLYFIKYIYYIFLITFLLRCMLFMMNKSESIIYGYIGFIGLYLLDYLINTNFITLSNSINEEIIWLTIMVLLGSVIMIIVSNIFFKSKEFYND